MNARSYAESVDHTGAQAIRGRSILSRSAAPPQLEENSRLSNGWDSLGAYFLRRQPLLVLYPLSRAQYRWGTRARDLASGAGVAHVIEIGADIVAKKSPLVAFLATERSRSRWITLEYEKNSCATGIA